MAKTKAKPPLKPLPKSPKNGEVFRHKRTGNLYAVLCVGRVEKTLEPAVVYVGKSLEVWIRPHAEFVDGRFTPDPPPRGKRPAKKAPERVRSNASAYR